MHRLKVIESFLAGGHWWEGENPYPYSVGGAASRCRMLPVQVWGVNFCVGPGQHWTYTCTRNILNIGHTHALATFSTLDIHMHFCCFSQHSFITFFFFSTWGVTLNKKLCISMPLVIIQLILWEVDLMGVDPVGS